MDGPLNTVALPGNPNAAVAANTDHLAAPLTTARARHSDLEFYLTGNVVMNRAFANATRDDFETLMPVAFLVIAVATPVLLRPVFATLAILCTIGCVVAGTLGFTGWVGRRAAFGHKGRFDPPAHGFGNHMTAAGTSPAASAKVPVRAPSASAGIPPSIIG